MSDSESFTIGLTNTSTPGADTNDYILFDSTTWTLGAGNLPTWVSRLQFTVENSQAGTLKSYRSTDKGTNWDQFGGDIAVAAAAATDVNGPYDFLVDAHRDVRLVWTNGGSAQTTWRPNLTGVRGYHGAAT